MRLPFFGSKKQPAGPFGVPLPEMVEVPLLVCFRSQRPTPPDVEQLKPVILAWLDRHAAPPLRDVLKEYLQRGLLQLHLQPRSEAPELPLDYLRHLSRGELEERRLEESTHVIMVMGMDLLGPLRAGFWTAIAAARALAQASGGVIIDLTIPRWLPLDTHEASIPESGAISMWEHIVIPSSVDDHGLGWITTKGMAKFGLPELQVKGVPPNLAQSLWPVVNGMAHLLLERVGQLEDAAGKSPRELVLEPEVRFDYGLFSLSQGLPPEPPPEGARGWTMIGLAYEPGDDEHDSFITLGPPPGYSGKPGVWYNSMLSDLLGADDTLRHVKHDTETMEAAHLQAMGELPWIRQRFQGGLPPGEQLLVKYGFPVQGGGHEYMWLGVNTWQGDRLRCQLANQPQYRTDLRAGMEFDLTEGDLFDWVLLGADGSQYGGWTNRVVEREGE